jgi:hypothetical protein
MKVEMLLISTFTGMTEGTGGHDKSSYLYIDKRNIYPTVLSFILQLVNRVTGKQVN